MFSKAGIAGEVGGAFASATSNSHGKAHDNDQCAHSHTLTVVIRPCIGFVSGIPDSANMPDREAEWRILRMAIDVDTCVEISESERPDFIVRTRPSASAYGVEITELFQTESHARLYRSESYMPSLFEGGPLIHKEDRKNLNVVRFTVRDGEGTVKAVDVPGIITKPITASARRQRIAEIIARKRDKRYDLSELTHIDLILYDTTGRAEREEYSATDWLGDGVREALLSAPFREVHWITETAEGTHLIRGLRHLLLIEQFFLLTHSLVRVVADESLRPDDIPYLFQQYAERTGFPSALTTIDGRPVVGHGATCIGISDDWGMQIYDFRDWELPATPPGTPGPTDIALNEEQWAACSQFVLENGFHCVLFRDPVEEPSWPGADPDAGTAGPSTGA